MHKKAKINCCILLRFMIVMKNAAHPFNFPNFNCIIKKQKKCTLNIFHFRLIAKSDCYILMTHTLVFEFDITSNFRLYLLNIHKLFVTLIKALHSITQVLYKKENSASHKDQNFANIIFPLKTNSDLGTHLASFLSLVIMKL